MQNGEAQNKFASPWNKWLSLGVCMSTALLAINGQTLAASAALQRRAALDKPMAGRRVCKRIIWQSWS
jgi:hypothetical protein